MKIMFVLPTIGGGGAERVATTLANCFVKAHDVTYCCLQKGTAKGYSMEKKILYCDSGISLHGRTKIKAVLDFFLGYTKIYSFVKNCVSNNNPDVIISFLPKADITVYLLHRKYKKFVWISSERNDPWKRNIIERFVLNHIYKKTDCLVCQTDKVSQYYNAHNVQNTITIRNPIIPFQTNSLLEDFTKFGRYAIAVGRLDHQKNYVMMIQSFHEAILQSNRPVKLLILGEGPLHNELLELIRSIGAKDHIFLLGKKENVNDYLAHAEFFIMSSDYEGMPNALLEAMNASLPVICTDFKTEAARELIKDNGFLVPVGNENEMTKIIAKMFDISKCEKNHMGLNSKKAAKEMSVKNIYNLWETTIERVMVSKNASQKNK